MARIDRAFFTYNNGAIGQMIGYIEGLGLHCPKCDTFVGGKSVCPNCNFRESSDEWKEEPAYDVATPTKGFVFRRKFVPAISLTEVGPVFGELDQVVDSRGVVYTKEEFSNYVKESKIEETVRPYLDTFLDKFFNNGSNSPREQIGETQPI